MPFVCNIGKPGLCYKEVSWDSSPLHCGSLHLCYAKAGVGKKMLRFKMVVNFMGLLQPTKAEGLLSIYAVFFPGMPT